MKTLRKTNREDVTNIAPTSLQKAVDKVMASGQRREANAVFYARALNALEKLADSPSVVEAASATSDYEVLLRALQSPESLEILTKSDPLALAKLRGLEVKKQLIEAEGGCISSSKVGELLGISRQAADKRRKLRKLIAIATGKGKYIYPVWQFSESGTTIEGLEDVLNALQGLDVWMQIAWMLDPNVRLEEKTPLEQLRQGNIKPVIESAIAFVSDAAD